MRYREKSEVRDGMRIDWDMPIKMDDGIVLRADVYRPVAEGKYPVIMTYGPYGKWLHFEDLYGHQWRLMCANHPDVPTGSTNKYQCWEVVDPTSGPEVGQSILSSPRFPRKNINAGRWWPRRSGFPMATHAFASIAAA